MGGDLIAVAIFFGFPVLFLNVILFFKVWGMTNNVKHILNYMLMKDGYEMKEERGAMWFNKKDDDKRV